MSIFVSFSNWAVTSLTCQDSLLADGKMSIKLGLLKGEYCFLGAFGLSLELGDTHRTWDGIPPVSIELKVLIEFWEHVLVCICL